MLEKGGSGVREGADFAGWLGDLAGAMRPSENLNQALPFAPWRANIRSSVALSDAAG